MFSIGACQALAACISPACKMCCPSRSWQLPFPPSTWLPQRIAVHALLSNGVALATVAVWLGFRDWAWAWLLQDLLGICLIVLVLRQFRLPNLKVRCRPVKAHMPRSKLYTWHLSRPPCLCTKLLFPSLMTQIPHVFIDTGTYLCLPNPKVRCRPVQAHMHCCALSP